MGIHVDPQKFSDYNLGRILDKIYETGTQRIFSRIAQNAVNAFEVDTHKVHFDTTSVSVYGDYDVQDSPFEITHGYSKDKRPDLKQFLISMLCVERNIPIVGGPEDGNASDKTLNNKLLTDISKHMAKHGLEPGAFVYVADAAFVTKDNLIEAEDNDVKFLTRLPATYKECSRAIQQAVAADDWIDIGKLAETEDTAKRPAAYYRAFETTVELHNLDFRAVVFHSSAHDKRRHKRIDRLLSQKRKQLEVVCKDAVSAPFFCRPDAQAAADKLMAQAAGSYHKIHCQIETVDKFPRGRPTKNKPRTPIGQEFHLRVQVLEDQDALAPLRLEAGCFVLLTSLREQELIEQWPAHELLRLYKQQDGIEKNFGFLKDPLIVNSIFLKTPHRIEVLGLVLLIALLIWRLMERCMRRHIQKTGSTITGWKDRPTDRPTSFMMTTKFSNVLVLKIGNHRQLARSLNPVRLQYLNALNVTPDVFTVP